MRGLDRIAQKLEDFKMALRELPERPADFIINAGLLMRGNGPPSGRLHLSLMPP